MESRRSNGCRTLEDGAGPNCVGDYSHEFIDELLNDIENSRVRAAHVLPRPDCLPEPLTNAQEIEKRLKLYHETGLRGYLIDVAKFAMRAWIEDEVRRGVCF
jgi:hypothetical protein